MNKRLATDMADANGLQRAIRPTGVFNIKKIAADFCSAQCVMDNTGSLKLAPSCTENIYSYQIHPLIHIDYFIYPFLTR